jgi:diguanylate cyclase (GGDEF)-like protein
MGSARRPARVSALASMYLVAGLCGAVSYLRPVAPESPHVLNAAMALVGCGIAAGLLLARAVPERVLHAAVLWGGLCTTVFVGVAATPQGSAVTAMAYTWVTLYAAYYLSRTSARVYTALNATCFAGALLVNPYEGAASAWAVITLTSLFGGERLSGLLDRLRVDARTDRLTGVLNRFGLEEAAPRRLADAERSGEPLAVALIDLDGFKQVNDEQGHAAGDALLVDLTEHWQAELRDGDVLARSGGDEFVLLLSRTDPRQAHDVLERLREGSPSSWSYGLAVRQEGEDLDSCLARADRDLYRAKASRATARGVLPPVPEPRQVQVDRTRG